jgi:hypothetical protein
MCVHDVLVVWFGILSNSGIIGYVCTDQLAQGGEKPRREQANGERALRRHTFYSRSDEPISDQKGRARNSFATAGEERKGKAREEMGHHHHLGKMEGATWKLARDSTKRLEWQYDVQNHAGAASRWEIRLHLPLRRAFISLHPQVPGSQEGEKERERGVSRATCIDCDCNNKVGNNNRNWRGDRWLHAAVASNSHFCTIRK